MPASDSNYNAATRHKRPLSTAGRPPALDVVDDAWAADTLSDDEIEVSAQREADLAQLLETEGELDDAVVVAAGQNGSAANGAARRREEGRWADLGLDNLDSVVAIGGSSGARSDAATASAGNR
jgi:hypothetical protein